MYEKNHFINILKQLKSSRSKHIFKSNFPRVHLRSNWFCCPAKQYKVFSIWGIFRKVFHLNNLDVVLATLLEDSGFQAHQIHDALRIPMSATWLTGLMLYKILHYLHRMFPLSLQARKNKLCSVAQCHCACTVGPWGRHTFLEPLF